MFYMRNCILRKTRIYFQTHVYISDRTIVADGHIHNDLFDSARDSYVIIITYASKICATHVDIVYTRPLFRLTAPKKDKKSQRIPMGLFGRTRVPKFARSGSTRTRETYIIVSSIDGTSCRLFRVFVETVPPPRVSTRRVPCRGCRNDALPNIP